MAAGTVALVAGCTPILTVWSVPAPDASDATHPHEVHATSNAVVHVDGMAPQQVIAAGALVPAMPHVNRVPAASHHTGPVADIAAGGDACSALLAPQHLTVPFMRM